MYVYVFLQSLVKSSWESRDRPTIIPQGVPYMVKLLRYYVSEDAVYLHLEHVKGELRATALSSGLRGQCWTDCLIHHLLPCRPRWEALLQAAQAEEREGQGTPRMLHFWPAQHQAENQLHLTHNQHRLPAPQQRETKRREPGHGLPHFMGRDSAATGELRDSRLHRGDGLSAEHALRSIILYQARSANSAFWTDEDAGRHPHPSTSS